MQNNQYFVCNLLKRFIKIEPLKKLSVFKLPSVKMNTPNKIGT